MKAKLDAMLRREAEEGRIPFHMPGHKRSPRYIYLNGLGAAMDVTEIDGFDNLHDASGVLAEGMALLREVYGAKRSFWLVNGSTGGLLAAVRCAVPFGGEVIMARNCHKAVYNAAELAGARVWYIDPPVDKTFGFCLDVPLRAVEEMLNTHPHAAAVILTSPTYDGVVSDIAAIAEVCHKRGIPLIVDEAHGAHLGFLDETVKSSVSFGADIVIHSFHKTLPSLTQTAAAHVSGDIIDADRFAAELSVFETSSPSYLLMSSLDGCTRLLHDPTEREAFFTRWRNVFAYGEELLCGMTGIRCFMRNASPSVPMFGYDRSKFAISAEGITGPALAEHLRRYNMEPEMTSARYVLLMTGADTEREHMDVLASALSDIPFGEMAAEDPLSTCQTERIVKMTAHEARGKARVTLPLAEVPTGAVSGDYVFAYPPGIPVVVPGEVITEGVKAALFRLLAVGSNPATLHGAFRGDISVVNERIV